MKHTWGAGGAALAAIALLMGAAARATEPTATPAAPAAGATDVQAAPAAPAIRKPLDLQGLRLTDLDGRSLELTSFVGKGPLVLDFWATWCKPCLQALPELKKLYADLQPKGLQIVGINEDGQHGAAKVKPFVQTQGIRFPILLDLDGRAQTRLNVIALPMTLLLDAQGRVVHTTFGYRSGEIDILRGKIESLVGPE